jgi:hypothetical protein
MPNADQISRTIEPGSLPQGDRQVVKDRLQQSLSSLQGGGAPSAPASGAPASGGPQDPLARLLGGKFSSDLPPTDGLSVGPGAGPASTGVAIASSPLIDKLRLIATEASSPLLRAYARASLRREIKKSV